MYHSARDNSQISSHIADAVGVIVFAFARKISALKSTAWARFYQRHPKAAEKNPLSVHAGTDRSIRLGAFMWRVVGLGILLNGLIRLR
jgi:hypothetical protein